MRIGRKKIMNEMKIDYILYSNDCPKCKVLKRKLDDLKIDYEVVYHIKVMESLGIQSLPMLQVGDRRFAFAEAIRYLAKVKSLKKES